jgi:hypothetical protein
MFRSLRGLHRRSAPVRSLWSFRLGRRTIFVFPLRGIAYGAVSVGVVFLVLLAVDRLVLGSLERSGWTAGELWRRHNKLIDENHRRKTDADEFQPRCWVGEPHPVQSPAAKKILVMGDSFIWGSPYLTLNHTWWRQLAIELERRGYQQVQVLAVGHPGWSTRQQLEGARKAFVTYHPDLVVWGYVANDPDEGLVPQIFDAQDRGPLPHRVQVLARRLLPNAMFKFESLRAQKLEAYYSGPKYGYKYPEWELKLLAGENFARYRQTVAEVGQFMKETGRPGLVVTLPTLPSRAYFAPRYAPVLPLWREAGLAVLDTLDAFVGRYGETPESGPEALAWTINPGDGHPGPRATHFFAASVADFLEQRFPETLGPRSDRAQPHAMGINDWLPFDLNVRPVGSCEFALDYPTTTEWMPRLPLDEPTALVALRFPMPVRTIRLQGAGLRGGRAWVSTLHPDEHYDEGTWHDLGPQSGDMLTWSLSDHLARRDLSMLRFQADVRNDARALRLTLISPEMHTTAALRDANARRAGSRSDRAASSTARELDP